MSYLLVVNHDQLHKKYTALRQKGQGQSRIILSAAAAGTVLKPSGGNCAVLPKGFAAPSAKKLTSINIPTFS